METVGGDGATGGSSRRYGVPFSASNLIQSPLTALLEYSGIMRPDSDQPEAERLIVGEVPLPELGTALVDEFSASTGGSGGEVSIRIVGVGPQESLRDPSRQLQPSAAGIDREGDSGGGVAGLSSKLIATLPEGQGGDGLRDNEVGEAASSFSSLPAPISSIVGGQNTDNDVNVTGGSYTESTYTGYEIQVARWIEQILPFVLLLLFVFIRQHLQGFLVTIWVSAVMFKSNNTVKKQTALKGERKILVIIGITLLFTFHIFGIYWWFRKDDLLNPLMMLPPKEMPPFWHAMFIILINDVMMRQGAMVLKCIILILYRNCKGRNYRKQSQMLTLTEYLLLLYRCLLPTAVWYRFFLNKEYGSLFSTLTTGLYLTFKLTSVLEKVRSFVAALKELLSHKEVHYGSYATIEQVIAAGDLCAICQEKMHAPILLGCKHIFCEDCVHEWFEREGTCPLCRALVRPAGLRSFGDGSTSLLFQLF